MHREDTCAAPVILCLPEGEVALYCAGTDRWDLARPYAEGWQGAGQIRFQDGAYVASSLPAFTDATLTEAAARLAGYLLRVDRAEGYPLPLVEVPEAFAAPFALAA